MEFQEYHPKRRQYTAEKVVCSPSKLPLITELSNPNYIVCRAWVQGARNEISR